MQDNACFTEACQEPYMNMCVVRKCSMRTLQAEPTTTWARVSTAVELHDAVSRGVSHISIESHLDMTHLSPELDTSGNKAALLRIPRTVKSITVCTHRLMSGWH
jgi:hypothetical protein